MGDLEWQRELNRAITESWGRLKNTLVMKDIVDPLIQGRVITLEYWMHLKSKPITESERMEDFLAILMKFDQRKYQLFLEALLSIQRKDLVQELLNIQKGKSKSSSTKSSSSRSSGSSRSSKKRSGTGQTDADGGNQLPQKPVMVKPRQTSKPTASDGFTAKQATSNTTKNQTVGPTQTGQSQPKLEHSQADNIDIGSSNQMSATDKLHLGIGTVDKPEISTAPQSISTNDRKQLKDQHNSAAATKQTGAEKSEATDVPASPNISLQTTIRDSDSVRTTRPNTARSKEEILEEREQLLESRESELVKREGLVKEKEEQLQIKEMELMVRENTVSTIHSTTAESLESHVKRFKDLQMGTGSASSTTDSAVLADVRAQLSEMNRANEEIESEHTNCNTPQEEYVKMKDFVSSQHKIEGLREEIETDRNNRKAIEEKVDKLQHKVEDLKHEISELQINIDKLEKEKEKTKSELSKELSKVRDEMTSNKKSHDNALAKIKHSMKEKDHECAVLKANIEDVVKTATDLEERVENLEGEKSQQEKKLEEYKKEISFLRKELEAKETEIRDLKKILDQTENEKEELIEEIADLKKDVSYLKAEKKQLESDRKTLLARCAKPQWSNSTRRSAFNK